MRQFRSALCLVLILAALLGMVPVDASAAKTYPNTYKNTGDQRADILGIARSQVGYKEGKNNDTKYGKWYRLNKQPWCAMFISWCADRAYISTDILKKACRASPKSYGFKISYKKGTAYTPIPGDLFFTETFSHVGFVYHVDGDYFYTIEGNSNNDGSDNGNRVLCLKRKIKDYYFGIPKYEGSSARPSPVVLSDKATYEYDETVNLSWEPVEGAVSYKIIVYRNGDIISTKKLGSATACALETEKAGDYLVSISAYFADGKESFGQCGFTLRPKPSLTVNYHANGGKIYKQFKTKLKLNLRKSASVRSTRILRIPKGKTITVTSTKKAGGYTWGKTTYKGKSGWCVVSGSYATKKGYALNSKNIIIEHKDQDKVELKWYIGNDAAKKLKDPSDLGLTRKNYKFVGWSLTPDGSSGVFKKNTSVTPHRLAPEFDLDNVKLTLYAIWKKVVSSISVSKNPKKTTYAQGEKLDTTGLTIKVKYADGKTAKITEGFQVTGFKTTKLGKQKLKVTYEGKTAYFYVKVVAAQKPTEPKPTVPTEPETTLPTEPKPEPTVPETTEPTVPETTEPTEPETVPTEPVQEQQETVTEPTQETTQELTEPTQESA